MPYFLLQVHVTDAEKKESLLLNKKRRKLILHNKAPMWNEASQVCIFYPLIVEIIRIAGFLNKYLKNSKLRHFQSFCEKSGIETKSVNKGIHLLWSITLWLTMWVTIVEYRLKYQLSEPFKSQISWYKSCRCFL